VLDPNRVSVFRKHVLQPNASQAQAQVREASIPGHTHRECRGSSSKQATAANGGDQDNLFEFRALRNDGA
jgi:hypothetical protein